jgi:hypothetical protein
MNFRRSFFVLIGFIFIIGSVPALKLMLPSTIYSSITLFAKINIDKPRCYLERIGLIETRRAHFSPRVGETVDRFRCREEESRKVIDGVLSSDIYVASDFGGSVERIDNSGRVKWRRLFNAPRGISDYHNNLLVCDINRIYVISKDYGEVQWFFDLPFNVSKAKYFDGKIWALSHEEQSSLYEIEYSENRVSIYEKISGVGKYPRDFDIDENYVYVANTLSHKIHEYKRKDNKLTTTTDSFYPNSVRILGDRHVLVAEEHLNSIALFDFINRTRVVRHACSSVELTKGDIKTMREIANRPINNGTHSPCRLTKDEFHRSDVFSPNDALYLRNNLYIADTDNHRVVVVNGNTGAHTSIYPFNSPVSIYVAGP